MLEVGGDAFVVPLSEFSRDFGRTVEAWGANAHVPVALLSS